LVSKPLGKMEEARRDWQKTQEIEAGFKVPE
jgi:hypothetical protein